ncbi:MAG: hypothetical protein JSU01_20010 [Bacteroidetes bacterium]|nr:hypothetical protein [Bacteroidota bacterium]
MGKKVALNVLYNICIFICLIFIYQGIQYKHYIYIPIAVAVGAVFVIWKVRLLKEVRNMQNKP